MELFYRRVCADMRRQLRNAPSRELLKRKPVQMRHVPDAEFLGLMQESNEKILHCLNTAHVIVLENTERITTSVEDLHLGDFANIKFPFDNFFVETVFGGNKLGVHVYQDRMGANVSADDYTVLINIADSDDDIRAYGMFIRPSKLPRIYFQCPELQKCPMKVTPTVFNVAELNRMVCQRTERTSAHCPQGFFAAAAVKTVIYAVNLINTERPVEIVEPKRKPRGGPKPGLEAAEPRPLDEIGKADQDRYIYISVARPRYVSKAKGSMPPGYTGRHIAPHERRGHYRHLRSGKVVWIEKTFVNSDKPVEHQKFYRLS